MNENFSKLIEWSVWSRLDEYIDLELILLKGHLYLELVLDSLLHETSVKKYPQFSFYRKVKELEKTFENESIDTRQIFSYLFEINRLRNKLAHEIQFDVYANELQSWSQNVLCNLSYKKFTNQTYRTKTVHAFSALATAIAKL